ncbi:hypothetical protein XENOCAPTIV_030189 [Xenoophorus captivus]|uniref:EGF-like domain-containing protein n=1 Tax=Xenoophorus captivus TaxID=1517983 RepID=A0ABV0R5P5_9TELE
MNKVWVPEEQQKTKAIFLSSKALDCAVPSLSTKAINTEDFMMDDQPYARWDIKALYLPAVLGLFSAFQKYMFMLVLILTPGDQRWLPVQPAEDADDIRRCLPEGSGLLFQLEEGPDGAVLSPAGLLIWRVPSVLLKEEVQQSFSFTLSDECNAQSTFTVEVDVVPCGCLSGGTCVTDVSFPAGSGKYLCVCPEGKQGELCGEDVDQCLSAPCAAGRCISTSKGYRCKCPAGLRGKNGRVLTPDMNQERSAGASARYFSPVFYEGLTCLEDINECEKNPCFPGVQCFNSIGSFSCGPCPKGMLGNGTTCKGMLEASCSLDRTVFTRQANGSDQGWSVIRQCRPR